MTIVVAVDARHAACIIDIDIGIESIDRVLSSRSPIVVVVPTTTTTARMIGHSGGDPLCLLTSIHIHGGTYHINYIGVMMYLIY